MRSSMFQHGCCTSGGRRRSGVGSLCVFSKPHVMFFWYLMAATVCIGLPNTVAQDTRSLRTGCPKEFLSRCHCGMVPYGPSSQLAYVTNCTDADFTSVSMLTELPPETEVLVFTGNEVKDLPFNIFGQVANYGKLHTVDLSNNRIQTIKGKTFHNVDSVKKLILNDNDLYIVGKDFHERVFSNFESLEELHLRNAFSEKRDSRREGDYLTNLASCFQQGSLNKLKVLNLENNEIETFNDEEIFCSLRSLEELYLSENRLTDVDMKLSCLDHLKKLDVSRNYITFLRNETLKHLDEVPGLELNLAVNRFICDCNMVEMYKWFIDTPVTILGKKTYQCSSGFPARNVGKLLFSLSLQDMQCPLEQENEESHPATIYVIVSIVFIFLAALAVFFLVRHRATVHGFILRYIGPIRSKYASLDRREESFMDV